MTDSLAARAYREVKQDIIMGRLVPGQVFLGAKLAQTLKMSRTPVHEALKSLAREGLVQVIPRVGYVVSAVTVNDVHEIFQLRLALETTAVDLAAARATPQSIEVLKRSGPEGRRRNGRSRSGAHDAALAAQAHRDLHIQIASISGNRRLVGMIGQLLDESQRLLSLDPLADEQRDIIGIHAHADIVRAIEKKDRRAAVDAMVRHLRSGEDRIVTALMPEPTTLQPLRTSRADRASGRRRASRRG